MIKRKQQVRHDPDNGMYGDCFRTAVGCLLNMEPEDVPHFMDPGINPTAADCYEHLDAWLANLGYAELAMPVGTELEYTLALMGRNNPNQYYLLFGESRAGVNHVVIARGGEIVHDPSNSERGLIKPTDTGYYWALFLVPLTQTSFYDG